MRTLAGVVVAVVTAGLAHGGQRSEDFSKDPGWDAKNNRVVPSKPYTVRQDFGWSPTNHAGEKPGEIGGEIWQSPRGAYYGKAIAPRTLSDSLSASGNLALLKAQSISGYHTGTVVCIGWFDGDVESLLWRPRDFLGIMLVASNEPDGAFVEFAYGTSRWATGASYVSGSQESHRIPPDGAKHQWSIQYDPKAGQATLTFDGVTTVFKLDGPHHKVEAKFNRFGIFPVRLPGLSIKVYLDDLTIDGQVEDFSKDPGWEAVGNRQQYAEMVPYGANDFGYSATNHAGGKPGELGGRFYSCNPDEQQFKAYYGDRIGQLTLNDRLIARGRFSSRQFSIDSTFALGWFNHEKQDWPIHNFAGVFFDSLSDVGRIVQTLYGTSQGTRGGASADYLTFEPDGTKYEWTLEYDPAAADGLGAITFTIGGKSLTTPLKKGDKEKGAVFDRFGVCNLQGANSKWCEVYLDDLTYTVGD